MIRRLSALAFACVLATILAPAATPAAAEELPQPLVHNRPLTPEANPWADKGIASKYAFGAYYTRKNIDNKPWHKLSRTDEYTDIMVKFDNSSDELLFWRGDNYLPCRRTAKGKWSFKRLFPQSDFKAGDRVNRNTWATVIENTPRRVVIHWRYLTEWPKDVGVNNLPDQTKCVDEYFIITPDRKVIRAVRPGCMHIEDWNDPSRVRVTKHKLAAGGILNLAVSDADRKAALELMGFRPAPKAPTRAEALRNPGGARLPAPPLSWSLDEGKGRQVREATTKTVCKVQGHGAEWRTGVAGTALEFDGYTTRIELPAAKALKITDKLTMEAWVCLAAYPWNYTALVQQGNVIDEGKGWFLGLDPNGNATVAAMIGGEKHVVRAHDPNVRVKRFRWTHVAGVIDTEAGTMTVYVDGRAMASAEVPKGKPVDVADAPVVVGQGPPMETAWPVGRPFGKFRYSVEGMIDEVRVFDKALSPKQVAAECNVMKMTDARRTKPDMPRRVMPAGGKEYNDFGAHFTHLDYHPSWNNLFRMSGHPDLVVSFDKQPGRYVLWHGVGYIPMMVTENGRWYSNEFNETWMRPGGCCEPMSDKKIVFGHVQILEQSPARVMLKWRYPLSNVGYLIWGEDPNTGWGEWCDWYLTIYPDGTVTKRLRIYVSKRHGHEWHESMAIFAPEQHPEQVVETRPALYVGTTAGEVRKYDWIDAPPERVDYSDVILHVVNMKAEYDPYTIVRARGGNVYRRRGPSPYSVFPAWNHWPVAQIPSDGRFVHFADRAAHSSLTHIYWPESHVLGTNGSYEEKLMMEGLSNASPQELLALARSYVDAPRITAVRGGCGAFDPNQRAYVLTRDSGSVKTIAATITPGEPKKIDIRKGKKTEAVEVKTGPVVNPAFVVTNWGADTEASIRVNGTPVTKAMDIRQGVVRRANGVNALVVWMELTSNKPVTIEIGQ